jgi:hypothetical protein
MMGNNRVLLGTWAAGIILVGYRSFHNNKGMPAPHSIIGVSVIWTMLSFFALIPSATKLANVLSVGVIGGLLLTDSSILGGGTAAAPTPANTLTSKVTGSVSSQINKNATATAP